MNANFRTKACSLNSAVLKNMNYVPFQLNFTVILFTIYLLCMECLETVSILPPDLRHAKIRTKFKTWNNKMA